MFLGRLLHFGATVGKLAPFGWESGGSPAPCGACAALAAAKAENQARQAEEDGFDCVTANELRHARRETLIVAAPDARNREAEERSARHDAVAYLGRHLAVWRKPFDDESG